jgi:hypothetical protein
MVLPHDAKVRISVVVRPFGHFSFQLVSYAWRIADDSGGDAVYYGAGNRSTRD